MGFLKILFIVISIVFITGCIDPISGKYVHKDGSFFILNDDYTFLEKFKEGNTISGVYKITDSNENITLIYQPWGGYREMEKVTGGYRNRNGGFYEKK